LWQKYSNLVDLKFVAKGVGSTGRGTRPHKYAAIFFVALAALLHTLSLSLPPTIPLIHNSLPLLLLARLNFKWPAPFGRIYMARCHFPLGAHKKSPTPRANGAHLNPFFFGWQQKSYAKCGNKQAQIKSARKINKKTYKTSTMITLRHTHL